MNFSAHSVGTGLRIEIARAKGDFEGRRIARAISLLVVDLSTAQIERETRWMFHIIQFSISDSSAEAARDLDIHLERKRLIRGANLFRNNEEASVSQTSLCSISILREFNCIPVNVGLISADCRRLKKRTGAPIRELIRVLSFAGRGGGMRVP